MAERQQSMSHPLLAGPTLWAVDIPKHLKWPKLSKLLGRCGSVNSSGRSRTPDGRQCWEITFSDVYHAEMALATLNGIPVPNMDPPWNLSLSHTSSLANTLPTEPLCAQFVKSSARIDALHQATAQDIFRWFRSAGPLVMIRTDVDVGYPHRTCMVQYWHEAHAQYALQHPQALHPALKNMSQFTLRSFAQCSVYVTNVGPNFHSANIDEIFGKYGTVIHSQVFKEGTAKCHCSISFRRQDEAFAAIAGMNNRTRDQRKIHVRSFEIGTQTDFRLQLAGGRVLAPHQATDYKQAAQPRLTNSSLPWSTEAPPRAGDAAYEEPPPPYSATPEPTPTAADTRRAYKEKHTSAAHTYAEAAEAAAAARAERIVAETCECAAVETHARVVADHAKAARILVDATAAVTAAQMALEAAQAHQAQMLNRFAEVAVCVTEADKERQAMAVRRADAGEREAALVAARELAQKKLFGLSPPEVAESRRHEAQQESIRRTRQPRGVEERDRRWARHVKEEKMRREAVLEKGKARREGRTLSLGGRRRKEE